MADHLRRPGRSGRQQHPLGIAAIQRHVASRRDVDTTQETFGSAEVLETGERLIQDDRVDTTLRDDRAHVLGREVGCAEDEPARDPVQLDKRHRRGKLIGREDEHRPTREFPPATPEAGTAQQIGQTHAGGSAPEVAGRTVRSATESFPNRRHGISPRSRRS